MTSRIDNALSGLPELASRPDLFLYNEKPGRRWASSGRTGGGYLLSHFRSIIGVVRFHFSVRNG